jgi:F-type H+-transporting ATPase subunit a
MTVLPFLADLHFPPISELVDWKALALKGTPLAVNKTVLLTWLGVFLTMGLYWAASRRVKASEDLVPRGSQNIVEATVEFVRNDIILQTIGPKGLHWTAFLVTMFFFIFFLNIFECIPVIQFPVTARMAVPMFLAIVVWLIFNTIGIKNQGFRGYMRSVLIPPGVPKSLLILVVPIEFLSTLLVRPFTLAVRLFANMLAGHLLLVTFAVLCAALFTKSVLAVILPLPFAMLVLFWAFEAFIALLQAFIFTILTAVYIGGAMEAEH